MTPLQLFHVGSAVAQLSSESDDNDDTTPPVATNHVQVPNTTFHPCSQLRSQIVQQSSQSDGCTLYRQVTTAVGVHLANSCTQCDCE